MTALTKDDITAIRRANDICIHLNERNPAGLVRLIKRKPYNPKPFDTDQEHVLPALVQMENDSTRGDCFAMTGIYHDQFTGVSSILKTLRVGDELTFRFYPDGHSNQYTKDAGLHADILYLDVRRNDKRVARWEFETSICPDNSARMCRNVREREYSIA